MPNIIVVQPNFHYLACPVRSSTKIFNVTICFSELAYGFFPTNYNHWLKLLTGLAKIHYLSYTLPVVIRSVPA
jgi:hypothetical protein